MNQQLKKKDYGAAWVKHSQYGELISVCLPVEFVQELLQQARDGKIWVTLASNSYKKEGSKQPDYKVLAPREQKFDAYNEQLPVSPPKRWTPPVAVAPEGYKAPGFEDDVPDFKPMSDESVPF